MTDPPAAGDLRSRIAAALRSAAVMGDLPLHQKPLMFASIAESLMPVITAAVTEATVALAAKLAEARITAAQREAWDHGYRNGYMDSGTATNPPTPPTRNPYGAVGATPTVHPYAHGALCCGMTQDDPIHGDEK